MNQIASRYRVTYSARAIVFYHNIKIYLSYIFYHFRNNLLL